MRLFYGAPARDRGGEEENNPRIQINLFFKSNTKEIKILEPTNLGVLSPTLPLLQTALKETALNMIMNIWRFRDGNLRTMFRDAAENLQIGNFTWTNDSCSNSLSDSMLYMSQLHQFGSVDSKLSEIGSFIDHHCKIVLYQSPGQGTGTRQSLNHE
jgi:hypothetical protein